MRRFRAHFLRPSSPHPGHPAPGGAHGGHAPSPYWRSAPGAQHACPAGPGATPGGRLNLLLSWGGWRPDSWADNMECLLRPLGVESMRARTARQAEQVIRSKPIHIAVVDLGLPLEAGAHNTPAAAEEAGCRILDLLRRLESPPPTVIVRSTRASRDAARDLAAALRFDAFAVVDRTSADVELMLKLLQRCLERYYHGRWPIPPSPRDP